MPLRVAGHDFAAGADKISGEIIAHQAMKARPAAMTVGEHAAKLANLGLNSRNLTGEDCALYVSAPLTDARIEALAAQGIRVSKSNWVPPVSGRHAHGFYLASVDYASLDVLRRDPRVVRVDSTERLNRPHSDLGRAAINVDAVQDGTGVCVPRDGSGVGIAIADSGIDLSHGDLPTPVEAFDMTDGTDPSTWGTNVWNTVREHGTHVAGIALGRGTWSPNYQYRGSAPGADLYFYKVTDDTFGFAGDADLIESVNRALAVGCDIYSLSFGGISDPYMDGSSALCQAIDNATANGMVCLVSAGNDGARNIHLQTSPPPGNSNFHCAYFVDNSGGAAPYTAQEWLQVTWRDGVSDGNIVLAVNNLGPGESLTPMFGNASPRGTEARVYVLTPNVPAGQTKMYCLQVQNTASSGVTPLVHVYRVAGTGQLQGTFASPAYTINHPGVADTAITVGAWVTRASWTDYQGNGWTTGYAVGALAPFSSLGPRVDGAMKPDVVASGSGIISCKDAGAYAAPWTFPLNYQTIDNDGQNQNGSGPANYYLQHGSSMATPLVAGGAALLLDAYPSLTPSQVRAALTATASNAASPDSQQGYGLIDITAAINSFDCDNNASADECDVEASSVSYSVHPYYPGSGQTPSGTPVAADLDGDGDADLASGSWASGYPLNVMWNNGNATFTQANQFITGLWWRITALAAGDFDRDGDQDLVVTQDNNPPFVRMLTNDGSGTFAIGGVLNATFWDEPMLYSEDLNLDVYPDVVFLHNDFNGRKLGVMLNNGDGTLAAPVVTGDLGGGFSDLRFADLDNDGDQDIVMGIGSDVGVFFNDSAGAFGPPARYPVGGTLTLDVGDLDVDGSLDVAVRSSYEAIPGVWIASLEVFLNDGAGSLTYAGSQNGLSADGTPMAIADANGDLIPDVVVASLNPALAPLLNDGKANFTFTEPIFSPGGLYFTTFLLKEDFNGDGKTDFFARQGGSPYRSVVWGATTPPNDTDCNANGFPDGCDIAAGLSSDCQSDSVPDECQLAANDCNANAVPDDCDLAAGTSSDSNTNGLPDDCEGIGAPAATVTAAVSRKGNPSGTGGWCDLALVPGVASEPRLGGVTEVRITFDVAPAGPGATPVILDEKTCASPIYAPYSGSATLSAAVAGNDLVLSFAPGLENGRTYRITIGTEVTSIAGQFLELRGLQGDVNSDGQVNATDRSVVVGTWSGGGFSCNTDFNADGLTNGTDRSIVVGAWTGGVNCAP